MSPNPAARKSTKRNAEIPISVNIDRTPRVRPVVKASVARPTAKLPKRHAPETKNSILRQPVHALPIEQRKRLMWGLVAIGMFVILVGWAMTLGHELRQDTRESNLISQLSNVFRNFKLPSSAPEPDEQEIRQLEKQVFPQF